MNKIKFLRQELNLTTRQISAVFSLADSTISQYENETRDINTSMLRKLSEFFHVTIDYLLCNDDLGLYVYYENSNTRFILTEDDYLKYKTSGLIYYIDSKRFININKKIGIDGSQNLSKLFELLSDYETVDRYILDNTINLPVPLKRVDEVKKIIVLDDDKFNIIKQMITVM
ncbi:MAG: helix-turn-helix domain-containing protein [Firmicutes bacterium]|nr:helix-turn-helix domain-containing protein [Bacillota bacterium]